MRFLRKPNWLWTHRKWCRLTSWFTEEGEIVLTWCRCNGDVFHGVIILGDAFRLPPALNEDQSWEKFAFAFSTRLRSKLLWIDSPTQSRHVTPVCSAWWLIPCLFPASLTVLCYGTMSADVHTAKGALGYHIVQLLKKYLSSSKISVFTKRAQQSVRLLVDLVLDSGLLLGA